MMEMEGYDASVRVLYDFEYTTKDGRLIKIIPGERLLLIKKTNNDWWQVIRSSEKRPFYAPASYVEEINKKSSKNIIPPQKDTSLENNNPISNEQSRKSSKPSLLRDLPDTSSEELATTGQDLQFNSYILASKNKIVSNTLCSSGYNSLCEEAQIGDEEHTLNVNKCVTASSLNGPKFSPIAISNFDIKENNAIIEGQRKNLSSSKTSINSNFDCRTSGFEGENKSVLNLPASDSLENLALQIEIKTSSFINNRPGKSSIKLLGVERGTNNNSENLQNPHHVEKNIQEQGASCGPMQGIIDNKVGPEGNSNNGNPGQVKLSSSFESVYNKPESYLDHSNLKYHGSFKTLSERQRMLKMDDTRRKMFLSCSEENDIDLDQSQLEKRLLPLPENNASSSINNVNSNCGQISSFAKASNVKQPDKTNELLQTSELKPRSFGSDSQLLKLKDMSKECTNSRHSLDSVVEGELVGLEQVKFKSRGYHFLDANDKLENSERSSTDSLLEVENNEDRRKISGGTTSDSIVPTDGEDLLSSGSELDSLRIAKSNQDETKGAISKRKPLLRRRRVFLSKTRDTTDDPPTPNSKNKPVRNLTEEWCEYETQDDRKYFYNHQTKERRWKPPRGIVSMVVQNEQTDEKGGTVDESELFVVSVELPSGWQSFVDSSSGQTCYVNKATGAKWFSSNDGEGRVYFFEENSNLSSWTLPELDSADIKENKSSLEQKETIDQLLLDAVTAKSLSRGAKSKSMISSNESSSVLSSVALHNWPQLLEGQMAIVKEGPLNKTKLTENGKRLRKHWTTAHAVLTELLLLFFKDNKGYPAMLSGSGRPELSVDLNGAVIDSGDKVSSRHHVHMLSTLLGLQVLIQSDCAATSSDWLDKIQAVIDNLPSSKISGKAPRVKAESPPDEVKSSRLGRSKSMKSKNKSVSIEDLSDGNVAERQTRIRERLKKFFHRRPTVDILVKKGIFKDEPVFGCVLEQICTSERPRVPRLVTECIRCIERSEENMKTDGLYRASGNLSQVQKIRCQVDQHNYELLDSEEDVHVLTGTLKLFFRELKQPIIPYKFFNKALTASTNQNRTEKIKHFHDIVKSLPPCNYDTLKCLLQHLLRVTQFQEFNRMHIPNIAIVFGPTLMWSEQESQNMACDLMQQNLVIECLLSDFFLVFG